MRRLDAFFELQLLHRLHGMIKERIYYGRSREHATDDCAHVCSKMAERSEKENDYNSAKTVISKYKLFLVPFSFGVFDHEWR